VNRLANGVRASYSYNNADQLTRLANVTSSATTLSSFTYKLDAVGNRKAVTEADGTRVTWSYDSTYQLLHEQRSGTNSYNVTYTYDPVGNRLTMRDSGAPTTYSYDKANQSLNYQDNTGRTTFAFDGNGNQLVTNSASVGRTTNTWDFENKLTKVSLASGIRNTFQYDGDGKRTQKQDSTGTTNFIWDEKNVLQEANQNNLTQVTYTLEPLQYGNLLSQNRAGTASYYHFDDLGNVQQLTSSAGTTQNNYLYRAYGLLQLASENVTNAYKYVAQQGYYSDPGTSGSYYVRARYYGPTVGRWLGRDPLASLRGYQYGAESINLYRYVLNSPPNRTDPSGSPGATSRKNSKCIIKLVCAKTTGWFRHCGVEIADAGGEKQFHVQFGSCEIKYERKLIAQNPWYDWEEYETWDVPAKYCKCIRDQVYLINMYVAKKYKYGVPPANCACYPPTCNSNYIARCLLRGCDLGHMVGGEFKPLGWPWGWISPIGWDHPMKECLERSSTLGVPGCREWKTIDTLWCGPAED
jgi:RHS repeat-associated protein